MFERLVPVGVERMKWRRSEVEVAPIYEFQKGKDT